MFSRITVATIKKNNNMKTISGNEAVEIAGNSPPFFLLNLDIVYCVKFYFYLGSASESFSGYNSLIISNLGLSLSFTA